MALRLFSLPDFASLSGQRSLEVTLSESFDQDVAGWCWFAPLHDQEHLALATDAGQFALLGINQPGNNDRSLFHIPQQAELQTQQTVERSQVLMVEEDHYWVILGDELHHLGLALDAAKGLRLVTLGQPLKIGEPILRSQFFPEERWAVTTVRHEDGSTHLVSLDLRTGKIRWQQQLGLQPVAAPFQQDSRWFILDRSGKYFTLTSDPQAQSALQLTQQGSLLPEELKTKPSIAQLYVVTQDQNNNIFAVLQQQEQRTLMHYQWKEARSRLADLPSLLAAPPLLVEGEVIMALANGYLAKWTAENKLETGPLWRVTASTKNPILLVNNSTIFITDGDQKIYSWLWPLKGRPQRQGTPWISRQPIERFTLLGPDTLAILDRSGSVFYYSFSERTQPLRRWVPPATQKYIEFFSTETPKQKIAVALTAKGTLRAETVDQGKIVYEQRLVAEEHEMIFLPIIRSTDSLLLATITGKIQEHHPATGELLAESVSGPLKETITHLSLDEEKSRYIVFFSDGTVGLLPRLSKKKKN